MWGGLSVFIALAIYILLCSQTSSGLGDRRRLEGLLNSKTASVKVDVAKKGSIPSSCEIFGEGMQTRGCSGVLIAPQWVLTSTKCLQPQENHPAEDQLKIVCGIGQLEVFTVVEVRKHVDGGHNPGKSDMFLLKLNMDASGPFPAFDRRCFSDVESSLTNKFSSDELSTVQFFRDGTFYHGNEISASIPHFATETTRSGESGAGVLSSDYYSNKDEVIVGSEDEIVGGMNVFCLLYESGSKLCVFTSILHGYDWILCHVFGRCGCPPKTPAKPSVTVVARPTAEPIPSTKPVIPTKPSPATSTEPVVSTKPATPTEPSVPTKPAAPTEPAVSTKPVTPTEPAVSTKPATSTEPAVSTKPATTTEPAPSPEPAVLPQPPSSTEPVASAEAIPPVEPVGSVEASPAIPLTPYLRPVQSLPPCPEDLTHYEEMTIAQRLSEVNAALHVDDYKVVRACICAGIPLQNTFGSIADNLLHLAAEENAPYSAWVLALSGVRIEYKNKGGRTPLFEAVRSDALEAAKALIAQDADIETVSTYGFTSIMLAAQRGYTEIVKIFIAEKADINALSRRTSKTPLILAAEQNQTEASKVLIDAGADLSVTDGKDNTALKISIMKNLVELVTMLVSSGADVSKADKFGNTPLHIATGYGCVECAKVLIDAGAEMFALNKDNKRPSSIICTFKECDTETEAQIRNLFPIPPVAEV